MKADAMKIASLAAVLALTSPAWASYSYYLTDNLTALDPVKWAAAGTAAPGASGLASADPNGGSLVSRVPIPDGSSEAEVRVTVRLAASGGTYTEFLQASADARTGGAGGGSYLAFEMQNPQFDAKGNCGATFVLLQSVGGVTSVLASFPHACRDGMEMRMAVHGGTALVWPDQAAPMEFAIAATGAGQPGIGAYATPAGNAKGNCCAHRRRGRRFLPRLRDAESAIRPHPAKATPTRFAPWTTITTSRRRCRLPWGCRRRS